MQVVMCKFLMICFIETDVEFYCLKTKGRFTDSDLSSDFVGTIT